MEKYIRKEKQCLQKFNWNTTPRSSIVSKNFLESRPVHYYVLVFSAIYWYSLIFNIVLLFMMFNKIY